MTLPYPEPDETVSDPVARIVDYLDFLRSDVRRLTEDLPAEVLGRSLVPSGWTVPGLVEHLLHMERRWLVWGFLGEDIDDPQGDRDGEGRWITSRGLDALLADLDAGGRRTADIVAAHDPLELASGDGQFAGHATTPTLLAILLHVLHEYSRHAGHLDIVRELIDAD